MKIIIIGAGMGGLSAYLALRQHLADIPDITITVYEAYPSPAKATSSIGGGLQLAPNGLRALRSLSPAVFDEIQARGFQGPIVTMRDASGAFIGHFYRGRKERYGCGQVLVARAAIHEALIKNVPEDAVRWQKRVRGIRETLDGTVEVEFEDGQLEIADFVVGADGVRSATRKAIFGDEYPAAYDGVTGVGGFLPISALPSPIRDSLYTDPVSMTFGSGRFYGYSPASPSIEDGQLMWWSTYEAKSPPPRDVAVADIRAQLLERHGDWVSPPDAPDARVFPTLVELACGSDAQTTAAERGVLVLPRYQIHGRLPCWSSTAGRIVLLGDAAHAMPPDGGQGLSCAVEDSVVLALLLKHFLGDGQPLREGIQKAVAGYEAVRMPRVGKIIDIANRRVQQKKKQNWWKEWLRNWALWFMCMLPESFNDHLFAYDAEAEVQKYINMTGS